MPELPEVEATRLSFADRISGASIVSAWCGKPLRWPLGLPVAGLAGRRVLGVRRRGKYLLLDLDAGLLLDINKTLSLSVKLQGRYDSLAQAPAEKYDLLFITGLSVKFGS